MENVFLFHYRSLLWAPLAHKTVQSDQQRAIRYRWSSHCCEDKMIWFWGTGKQGEKDKQFGLQTSSHEQEEQGPKSWIFFFPPSFPWNKKDLWGTRLPEEVPYSHPNPPTIVLSIKVLISLGQLEYAHLKSSPKVQAGCHMSQAVSYGSLNTAYGWVSPSLSALHRASRKLQRTSGVFVKTFSLWTICSFFYQLLQGRKKTFLKHKRQVSTWKLMTKLNLCSPCILRWHQITQWAFLASRYLSARWITSFSESSEMFGGPFIKEYSSHLSTSAMLTNHNVLLFSPASSSLPFHKFSYQCHSSPHLVLHIPAEMR